MTKDVVSEPQHERADNHESAPRTTSVIETFGPPARALTSHEAAAPAPADPARPTRLTTGEQDHPVRVVRIDGNSTPDPAGP